jgi:DNA-binding response OmpR family regulator
MSRILIIEDEESQRKALRDALNQKGYSILEAGDGIEGLRMALREHPDLILLDVRMPKMDGMAVVHKLREDAWGKSASIIILTNYDTNDVQIGQITADLPSYYLIKADSPLEKVVKKIEIVLTSKKKKESDSIS